MSRDERVMVLGAGGQLGREIVSAAPPGVELLPYGREALDVTDDEAVADGIGEARPDVVVNCAAWTDVDRAETEPEAARAVNAVGSGNVARAAKRVGARLVHLSTDFVFDGEIGRPYRPDDAPSPVNVYGATKREGEERVLEATDGRALVMRTSWLYSSHGACFPRIVLDRLSREEPLYVVADQIGAPTWAGSLSRALWRALEVDLRGIHHWTDAGVASRFDLAVAVREEALAAGLLTNAAREVLPVPTEAYPLPARRPPCVVLDCFATCDRLAAHRPHWRVALREMIRRLAEEDDA